MNIGQRVCSSLMGSCKLHAALSVDVLYTKTHSDGFNGSEDPMVWFTNHTQTVCELFGSVVFTSLYTIANKCGGVD